MVLSAPRTLEHTLVSKWVALQLSLRKNALSPDSAPLVVYWPHARMNRYQALLYCAATESSVAVHPLPRLEDLERVSWPGPIVFHAHWFASLHGHCESEDDADAANERALTTIDAFRDRTGAALLWTAHNLFPHNTRFPRASLTLRRSIMKQFDVVHTMSDAHIQVLTTAYGIPPKRHFVVPHMMYTGVYPDYIQREEAREILSISEEEYVFLSFGAIQEYKGLEDLVRQFKGVLASGRGNSRLIIAGVPTDASLCNRLAEAVDNESRIVLDARRIPDEEVQVFFRAADAVALPYRETLNSGAAALAMTFRKQVVAPSSPAFEQLSPASLTLYDVNSIHGLMRAMIDCIDDRNHSPPDEVWVREREPMDVSRQFFEKLRAAISKGA